MRKIFGVALLGFIIASAFLWANQSRSSNPEIDEPHFHMSVKPANLSEETKRILDIVGQDVQLFDLKADTDQASSIRIWLEHFEQGVQKENVIDIGSNIWVRNAQEESGNLYLGQLLLSIRQMKDEQNEERRLTITTALMDQGGSSSTTTDVHLPLHTGSRFTWTHNEEKELSLHQPITLISMAEMEDDERIVSFSGQSVRQYDATGEWPEELGRYDRLLLFRIMLQSEEGL